MAFYMEDMVGYRAILLLGRQLFALSMQRGRIEAQHKCPQWPLSQICCVGEPEIIGGEQGRAYGNR
ncbi:MAG: hypothetical protein JWP44_5156 [Mucilaginibacter sp.]|jgi:hypothetical protein|nr:hypothetical protein [Mucilaginibacter sp.]